jgi:large subunit ribosomal protein L24
VTRIRKGDTVEVLSGKQRGKRGQVMRVIPVKDKVIVDGANMSKKHTKPRGQTMQGGIIDKDMPMPASAVAIVCAACGRPSRIGVREDESGRKLRYCKRCGSDL